MPAVDSSPWSVRPAELHPAHPASALPSNGRVHFASSLSHQCGAPTASALNKFGGLTNARDRLRRLRRSARINESFRSL